MNFFNHLILNSVEYEKFGKNLDTFSAVMTALLTFAQARVLLRQNKSIWVKKSAESMSAGLFSYMGFSSFTYLLFGYYQNKLAVMFNGLFLGLLYIPIVIGVIKYNRSEKFEYKLIGIFSLMLPAMIIVPWKEKEHFFIATIVCTAFVVMGQANKIKERKSTGDLDPGLIKVSLLVHFFWSIYFSLTKDLELAIFNVAATGVYIVAYTFWSKYGKIFVPKWAKSWALGSSIIALENSCYGYLKSLQPEGLWISDTKEF